LPHPQRRQRADALFDTNSTFQVVGSSSPDSFSNTVALTPGTTLLDGGALSLTLSIVPASGGAEWLVFDYSTTAGGAISQPNQNWSLSQNGLVALQPLNFIASYAQFNNNGTAIAPSYAPRSGPIPERSPIWSGLRTDVW
jgi:hypothetical protein